MAVATVRATPVGAATPRVRGSRRLLLLAAACLAAGVCGLFVDVPLARWLRTFRPPRELLRLVNFSEVFAHGTGVAMLLVAVLALDRSLRPGPSSSGAATTTGTTRGRVVPSAAFARLVAAAYAGGLLADAIKAVVDRVRPRALDFATLADMPRSGLPATLAAALDTFGTSALAGPAGGHADVNSFPSGHAAVAAGFAAALSVRYPHAAWCFTSFAVLAATQRVVTLAHYPSDVACGAALGLVGAALCLHAMPVERQQKSA